MYTAPIVFCERTGNWAAAARRAWSRRAASPGPARRALPRLIETRSAQECREVTAANRGSFVVVELESPRTDHALDLLFDLGVGFAETACVVVANRPMRSYEWLTRELGALAFIVSPLELDILCDLAERHVDRTVVESTDLREHIWQSLPWG